MSLPRLRRPSRLALLALPPLLACPAGARQDASAPVVLELGAEVGHVNLMKGAMPKVPAFPKLSPKKGHVRGFVKDANGKPLAGAKIGVRVTVAGGFYSGAQGKTDARGYYEIEAPWGAAHYYCAGHSVDYGDGRAAMGLHPADGEADSFATANGAVENWVLLPYGVGDRDGAQDKPAYSGNYYGGTFSLDWDVHDGSIFAKESHLRPGSAVEVTLTPDGPLIDGSRGRTFVLRKPVTEDGYSGLTVVNVPVGAYRIEAKLVPSGGGAPVVLNLRETGLNSDKPFGLEPRKASGKASLLLRPYSAKPESATASHGNWTGVEILLEK